MQSNIEPSLAKLEEALKKHYWDRLKNMGIIPQNTILCPFNNLTDYVIKAWKAGLGKRQECSLAGSELLGSVLKMTNRRWTSSVEEANEIYLAGMNAASYLWDTLDKINGDIPAFQAKADEIKALFKKEFSNGR